MVVVVVLQLWMVVMQTQPQKQKERERGSHIQTRTPNHLFLLFCLVCRLGRVTVRTILSLVRLLLARHVVAAFCFCFLEHEHRGWRKGNT